MYTCVPIRNERVNNGAQCDVILIQTFSSHVDGTNFCLAHLFTHQSFWSRGSSILGLAYIASPRPYSIGGICTNGEANMK
jgi:hypothetical protein